MKVEFDKSFGKYLEKIRNKSIFPRVEKFILDCEKAKSLTELRNIKKSLPVLKIITDSELVNTG